MGFPERGIPVGDSRSGSLIRSVAYDRIKRFIDHEHSRGLPRKSGVLWTLIGICTLAAAYFGTACVGLVFAVPPGNATSVWPPSGLALATLLIFGWRFWPGIWLGAFLISASTDVSLTTAAIFASGNTLEAIVAVFLCKRFLDSEQPFGNINGAFFLILTAAFTSTIAATFGAFGLLFGGYLDRSQLLSNWSTWWLGDLTGIMLVTPLFLLLRRLARPSFSVRNAESLLALTILGLISQAIFGGWLPEQVAEGFLYLPLIVIFWLLLRFQPFLVIAGNLIVAVIAIWGTSRNVGAFATEAAEQSLFDLQIFVNVCTLTSLVLIGILSQARTAEKRRLEMDSTIRSSEAAMKCAREIQSGLFPAIPPKNHKYQCAGECRSADLTGGDYFDFIMEPDGAVVMIVADVSGHGFGPALVMAETRAYAHAILKDRPEVSDVVKRLNGFLYREQDSGRFITLFVCRFDPRTSSLEYAGAGHEGFVIKECGRVERLESTSIPLGFYSEIETEPNAAILLKPNDIVLLATDGITEATSKTDEMFGEDQLLSVVVAVRDQPVAEIQRAIFDEVTEFTRESPLSDDMTIALLRIGNVES